MSRLLTLDTLTGVRVTSTLSKKVFFAASPEAEK